MKYSSTRRQRVIATLAPFFVVLSGCGSDDDSDSSTPAAATTDVAPVPAATAPPTPAPPAEPVPETPEPTPGAAVAASPASKPITGVSFDWSSHLRSAENSDNWPTTWSNDDHQYAIWGDGGGVGGTEQKGRASLGVARIEGGGGNYQVINRYGGVGGECRSVLDAKAHGAPISIGGILYAWLTPGSGPGEYATFSLYRSNDKGCTWKRLGVKFDRAASGISFGSFVQFGKDNTASRDAYVYTVAPEVTNTTVLNIVQRPGKIMLLRVPAIAIEKRSAYEFYAGPDSSGQPTWSTTAADRIAIYEDTDGVGPFPQMTYVPGPNRFVYTNQHGDGKDNSGFESRLTMAEAPNPWGPWDVFYHAVFFPEIQQTVFQWNFAPKWLSNNGRDFTLIFSGVESNDSWNTIKGTFTTQ